ncbi:MAG TPA: hypothetical protein VNA04_13500 [Thermoanaerobaculia bacterium]|nr:hypothetical protein [Thermoanaerobaculia bacterium]
MRAAVTSALVLACACATPPPLPEPAAPLPEPAAPLPELTRAAVDRLAREDAQRALIEATSRHIAALEAASGPEAEALRRRMEELQFALRVLLERERLAELNLAAETGPAGENDLRRLRREREELLARAAAIERELQALLAAARRRVGQPGPP